MGRQGSETLLIRADANASVGMGHFVRCWALAQAWKEKGGEAFFATSCKNELLLSRLREEGIEIIPLQTSGRAMEETLRSLARLNPSWVVLDGYHFTEEDHKAIKKAGIKLLVVDDMAHLSHYFADLVLNQNIHAAKLSYFSESFTKLLLGTEYALLRRSFLSLRDRQKETTHSSRKILISLGGSDPENSTLKVLQALSQVSIQDFEGVILWGPENSSSHEVKDYLQKSGLPFHLVERKLQVAELMAEADLAITAGGSTCWELCCLGVPMVVVPLSPDQELLAQGLKERGCAMVVKRDALDRAGELRREIENLLSDSSEMEQMADRAQALVDGRGALRVVEEMQSLG